ncbi:MAG: alkaline phosphatase family protein [Gemmatimonadetes bacterium]|nr:alkaline phosphatase family protein [Gemmatimonadota bacterium]
MRLACLALAAAASLARSQDAPRGSAGHNAPRHANAPVIVMLSIDGFRSDYLDRFPAPNFARLLAHGVRAEGLVPAYPSKTFPNHYTLVTGLYTEHHGLVANRYWDPERNAGYGMADSSAVRDGSWYLGEPVWVTAERQGMVAASYFWPGSEAAIGGIRPSRTKAYDGKVPIGERVDTVLAWLDLPAEARPHLVTMYFSTTDDTGHRYGPDAAQTGAAVRMVDAALGRLLDGLERLDAGPGGVELLIVADHGMAWSERAQYVELDTVIDLAGVRIPDSGPGAVLFVAGGRDRAVVLRDSINRRMAHGRAYLRADVPAELHYRESPRIGDLVLVMDLPWQVGTAQFAPRRSGATHGWAPSNPEMRAVFVSWRPSAAGPRRTGIVQNVDVACYITERLGLAPAPLTDGVPGRLARQLREATP